MVSKYVGREYCSYLGDLLLTPTCSTSDEDSLSLCIEARLLWRDAVIGHDMVRLDLGRTRDVGAGHGHLDRFLWYKWKWFKCWSSLVDRRGKALRVN